MSVGKVLGRQDVDGQIYQFGIALNNFGSNMAHFAARIAGMSTAYLQSGIATAVIQASGGGYVNSTTTATVATPTGIPDTSLQVTATLTLAFGLGTLALHAAGTVYTPGDVLTLPVGTGGHVVVDTITGGGGTGPVGTFHVSAVGTAYLVASAQVASGGTGSGAQFDITNLVIVSAAVATPGSGYGALTPPAVIVADTSGGTGAVITTTLANIDAGMNYDPTSLAAMQAISTDLGNLAKVILGTAYIPSAGNPTTGTGYNFTTNIAPAAGFGF